MPLQVVTNANWNDPILNWWRDIFDNIIAEMWELPSVYCKASGIDAESKDVVTFWAGKAVSPYMVDDTHCSFPVIFGSEIDYSHILIPFDLRPDKESERDEATQKHWLYFGWYKRRGCTERVVWVNWNMSCVHPVTYEGLRQLAVCLQGSSISLADWAVEPVQNWAEYHWMPTPEQLAELLKQELEFEP